MGQPKKTINLFDLQQAQNINQKPEKKAYYNSYNEMDAHSPYNFIPLNEKVINREKIYELDKNLQDNDKYHNELNTGYINIEIETKTPIYIRDTSDINIDKNSKFNSPTGNLSIPGSSIRGMIRTLVEILSFSKFGYYDNKKFYYRAVADTTKLGNDYKDLMININDNFFPKVEAGILKKEGLDYIIYPSKKIKGTQIYRINYNKDTNIIEGTHNYKLDNFKFDNIYFNPIAANSHTHYRKGRNGEKIPYNLKYAKLINVSKIETDINKTAGYIISSGHFNNKHMHWVINDIDKESEKFLCSKETIENYKNDKNKEGKTDLLKMLEDHHDTGVPCFFLTELDENKEKKVIYLGHTGMFRLGYKKDIKDFIIQNNVDIDITQSIFGKEDTFAGRVYFEDCIIEENQSDVLIGESNIKILGDPKPTTFQHYLHQNSNDKKNLNTYNDNTKIRGNKLYWHKSSSMKWREEQANKNTNMENKINPVRSGIKFKGKIRFENLSSIELGALLQSLNLPNGCMHKIGMGKPYGLGSIHITPKLYLSNRENRYKNLFSEWVNISEEKDINKYMDKFKNFVTKELNEKSYWEIKRLKELKTILNYEKGCKLENEKIIFKYREKGQDKSVERNKTEYMTISPNEFKNRPVLPFPSDV